ncbi:MAG: SoxR reducing system RseC family protein [Deltaproteobacteria bacterium]|nr:SoxR reducing system RseC family protein [Deltaproteobacteria bacterium]
MSGFYRQGEVVFVEGDKCEIQLSLSGFCSGEHKCAITAFAEGIPPEMNRVTAPNSINAQTGEKVIVEVISPGFYKSLLFVLILPLIALLLGCVLGIQFAVWMGIPQRSDLYAGIGGVIFFSCSLLISRSVNQRVQPKYTIHNRIDKSSNCKGCLISSR